VVLPQVLLVLLFIALKNITSSNELFPLLLPLSPGGYGGAILDYKLRRAIPTPTTACSGRCSANNAQLQAQASRSRSRNAYGPLLMRAVRQITSSNEPFPFSQRPSPGLPRLSATNYKLRRAVPVLATAERSVRPAGEHIRIVA
jgi:hypothetical protein